MNARLALAVVGLAAVASLAANQVLAGLTRPLSGLEAVQAVLAAGVLVFCLWLGAELLRPRPSGGSDE